MTNFLQSLRFSFRQLRRSPGFAITATVTLALGVGANTAIFSLLDQALLRSLPVQRPEQLLYLEGTGEVWEGHSSTHGGPKSAYFSHPMYLDLRNHNRVLSDLAATSPASFDLVWAGAALSIDGEIVSGNYFQTLRTRPFLGRLLSNADDSTPGANPVVVLSYSFWQNQLGGTASIVGSTITLNTHPFQVVGIAGPEFHSGIAGETPALFVPLSMLGVVKGDNRLLSNHQDRWLNLIGRLAEGQTVTTAQAGLAPLWYALRAEELKAMGHRSSHFVSEFLTRSRLLVLPGGRGFSYTRDDLRQPLLVVMGMAALVLLIAAVNVATLLLVRSASRVHEFSVRSALGARMGGIAKQLLLEGSVIGLLGTLLGLALAPAALRMLVSRLADPGEDTAFSTALDSRLLLYTFVTALVVSLGFSLAPVFTLRRPNLTAALRGISSTTGARLGLFVKSVVCFQIGVSLLLLIGSGLFVQTLRHLRRVDVGFKTEQVLHFAVNPQLAGYTPAQAAALEQRILDTLSALPEVEGIGSTDNPALSNSTHGGNISVQGYHASSDEDMDVTKTIISPGFFDATRVPLLAGRGFGRDDDQAHPRVAIINEALAKKYLGGTATAVGKRLADGDDAPDTEIVGVVRDFKQKGVRREVQPTVFRPFTQGINQLGRELYFYLPTRIPSEEVENVVRKKMQEIDPSLALDNVGTMQQQIDHNLRDERNIEFLSLSFGSLATLLAAIGLYGVLAYTTAQRTKEIGIRMAMGSSRWGVSRLVVGDVLRLTGSSLAVALPASVFLGRLVQSELYNVSSSDPLVLTIAVILTACAALCAAFIPAHRATKVSPTTALRSE